MKKFSGYSTGEMIRQFDARPDVAAVYAENNLTTRPAPTVPVFQYHAAFDEIVPLGQAQALNRAWCSAGVRTVFALVPGDHIAGETAGLPAARLAGRPLRRAARTHHLLLTSPNTRAAPNETGMPRTSADVMACLLISGAATSSHAVAVSQQQEG
ncbi:lipase family protein [Amycolatopsis sp. NPDC058278]|uniref:lipase family protein n=1 Tax=Amycolatopsis sp. NPDC058278 TaxID=3346417 RepID=UPI0036DEB214